MYKFLIIVAIFSTASIFSQGNVGNQSPQKTKPCACFKKAHDLIKQYKEKVSPKEQQKLHDYFSYYRSWYQSVVPAPIEDYEQLSAASQKLTADLKELAQQYSGQKTTMPGASRLTPAGERFYKQVLEELKN